MRLIHTETLEFKEFFDAQIPKYAILSHRWGDDEITYKDLRKGQAPLNSSGFVKLHNFCKLAAERGFEWAWMDTCCIDKRSSAELTEAINSMYKWYERSEECYVHLSDVRLRPDELSIKDLPADTDWPRHRHKYTSVIARFQRSSWFTRGWTLQELLAPRKLIFFDCLWREIGPRSFLDLDIARATGIDVKWLKITPFETSCASVASRMSWASKRHTSREEDIAYCLLGLFDVSMPLLYGEGGKKAFFRLQNEIMKQTDDESLFAWTADHEIGGMLATHPSCFQKSGDIVRSQWGTPRPPYSVTNKGFQFSIPEHNFSQAFQTSVPEDNAGPSNGTFPVLLCCERGPYTAGKSVVRIHLKTVSPTIHVRIHCGSLFFGDPSRLWLRGQSQESAPKSKVIYIATDLSVEASGMRVRQSQNGSQMFSKSEAKMEDAFPMMDELVEDVSESEAFA